MIGRELDQQLIGEAWTSTEAYANLERLCDIGSRFAGSPSGRAARDFILSKFGEYGLEDAHAEPFDFLVWTRGECALTAFVEGEARPQRSAISLVYSPNAERLRGELVDCGIGSAEEYARAFERVGTAGTTQPLAGRIAMVTTANPEGERPIHRRTKYGRAVEAGAVGFVYANHTPGMLAETGSLRPGRLGEIPAVGVSYEEGWELARRSRRGPVQVELNVRNQAAPGQGFHVVGEVPGRTAETVLVGAHYDGHDISQGARDDATGTADVLELARLFGPMRGRFRRTIRLVAFDAEELGVLGAGEYVKAHAGELERIALMMNLDSAAGPVETHGFLTGGFRDTEAVLRGYAEGFGYPLRLRDRVQTASDNFPFFMAGIPAICMTARAENPALGRGFGHTAADTLDKVSEVEVKAAVMTIARMLARLAEHEGSLGARRTPEQIRQILVEQNLEAALRAEGKWPW